MLGHAISWRDIILIAGGFSLLYKGTREVHQGLEGHNADAETHRPRASLAGVVAQIMLLDIVFSPDSIITAIGMDSELWVMAAAIAIAIMLGASGPLSAFVERHPTVKMLALSFPAADRHDADCRWRRPARAEGIYLCGDRFLNRRRGFEPDRRRRQKNRRGGAV